MDKENFSIYKKLKEIRRARGLTVNTLAEKMNENPQKVSRVERGHRSLTVGYLAKIAKALETPMEDLLEEQNHKKTKQESHPELLNSVVLFVEEFCTKISPTPGALQKAEWISKVYEVAKRFPGESQNLFLSSLTECIKSLMKT